MQMTRGNERVCRRGRLCGQLLVTVAAGFGDSSITSYPSCHFLMWTCSQEPLCHDLIRTEGPLDEEAPGTNTVFHAVGAQLERAFPARGGPWPQSLPFQPVLGCHLCSRGPQLIHTPLRVFLEDKSLGKSCRCVGQATTFRQTKCIYCCKPGKAFPEDQLLQHMPGRITSRL